MFFQGLRFFDLTTREEILKTGSTKALQAFFASF